MAALVLKLTDAGLAAVQAAAGSDAVVISELGLTNTPFDYAPTLTALPGEFKRLGAVSGVSAAANIAHLSVYDTSQDVWSASGLGLFLEDGTLFAIHSSPQIVQTKASVAFALISIDIIFNADLAANIAFGNAGFTNPPATTEMRGIIELATIDEAKAGLDDLRGLTPKAAASAVLSWLLHTGGAGSKLDADLLDGREGSAYLAADSFNRSEIVDLIGFEPMNATRYNELLRDVGSNLSENGYVRLSNGLMLAWGRFTTAPNSLTAVTFPMSFPTACFSVVAGGVSGGGSDSQDNWPAVRPSTITAQGFGVFSANDASDVCTFFAVGF